MIVVYLFLIQISLSSSFHIYLDDSIEKCFVEKIANNILINANYEQLDKNANNACSLYIRSPNGKIVTRQDISVKPKGKLSYISDETGTFKVCAYCSSGHWANTSKSKLFLSIETADAGDKLGLPKQYDLDPTNAAKKHEIETLIDEIQKFTYSISSIRNEQALDDFITNKFYKLFANVHKYIMYFYIVEMVALCASVIYSIIHLKRYFKARRLI